MSDAAPKPPEDKQLHCPKCGYDLTGLSTQQCPECGTPFDLTRLIRESNSGGTQFMSRGTVALLLVGPSAMALGLLLGLVSGNESVASSIFVLSLVFSLIASFLVGSRTARAIERRTPDKMTLPGPIMMTVLYTFLFLCLEVALILFAFLGACGTTCAFVALTRPR